MKRKSFMALVLSVLLSITLISQPVSALDTQELNGVNEYLLINSIAETIEHYYKFGTTREEMVNAALFEKLVRPDGDVEDMLHQMMISLDPNSSYLWPDDYERFMSQSISGEFAGIGISVSQRSGRIIVVSPIPGTPAEKAGVRPNDIIVYVNGEDVSSTSVEYVQSVVKGEIGTSVNIGILRGETLLYFDIVREKIKDQTVSHSVLDDNIGYIAVSNFNHTTVPDAKMALADLDSKGVTKLIVDLRNNPGGELQSAVDFCGLFVPKGIVAHIRYKDATKNEIYYSELEEKKYEIALLINEGSASASELFAAAAQDTGAGTLFGTTTYGKGTMQVIMPVEATGGALRLTIAEYLSAGGRSVNEVGVIPDYYVENRIALKDTTYFSEIDFSAEHQVGSGGGSVLALEQRLEFLGYFKGVPDTFYDDTTQESVKTYQAYQNLPATGDADLYTLLNINNVDYENMKFLDDKQLENALTYLKSNLY